MSTLTTFKDIAHIASIPIPDSVQLVLQRERLYFLGPLGISFLDFASHAKQNSKMKYLSAYLFFKHKNQTLHLYIRKDKVRNTALSSGTNTIITHLKQKICGISRGYVKELSIVGIGYRVSPLTLKSGEVALKFKFGFTNEILYFLPKGVQAFRVKPDRFYLFSNDLQRLSSACAEIKVFKKPDPYKGKGVRYKNEIVQLRVGKRK